MGASSYLPVLLMAVIGNSWILCFYRWIASYTWLLKTTEHSLFVKYRSVPHIRPPSRISPPYVFSQSSCTGIFISRIGPPTMAILPKWSSSKLLHCQVQGPRGNARTEPASTEQLRNSPSIASVSASGVNQQQHIERTNPRNTWKTPLSTLWPTSVSRSWPSSFWDSGTTELLVRADRQLLSVCNTLCQHPYQGMIKL